MSVRMQVFLALAVIVGAFAFGVGVLVLDRINARAALLGEEAAQDEAAAIAAIVAGEMEGRSVTLRDVAKKLGASVTPVRIALKQLAGEGLVDLTLLQGRTPLAVAA